MESRRSFRQSIRSQQAPGRDRLAPQGEEEVVPDRFESHCNACPYRRNMGNRVEPAVTRLPLNMEYRHGTTALLILQAPGLHEWANRRPICSDDPHSAAAKITNSLERIGASRCDCSITNAVQCLPGAGGRGERIETAAHGQCANWLRMDIEAHLWSRIVVFGRYAELSVRCLGYGLDPRFRFIPHPTGGRLTSAVLDGTLRWALEL